MAGPWAEFSFISLRILSHKFIRKSRTKVAPARSSRADLPSPDDLGGEFPSLGKEGSSSRNELGGDDPSSDDLGGKRPSLDKEGWPKAGVVGATVVFPRREPRFLNRPPRRLRRHPSSTEEGSSLQESCWSTYPIRPLGSYQKSFSPS